MIQLRPVEEKDTTFIEAVYRTTREAELNLTNWSEHQKSAFISMQSAAQLADYKTKCPGAIFQVIIYNKKDAGRFFTCETENDIHLLDISLLPEFTGKGIGTNLLHRLIQRSTKVQKNFSLCNRFQPSHKTVSAFRVYSYKKQRPLLLYGKGTR